MWYVRWWLYAVFIWQLRMRFCSNIQLKVKSHCFFIRSVLVCIGERKLMTRAYLNKRFDRPVRWSAKYVCLFAGCKILLFYSFLSWQHKSPATKTIIPSALVVSNFCTGHVSVKIEVQIGSEIAVCRNEEILGVLWIKYIIRSRK